MLIGLIITSTLILNGKETRERMNREVEEAGRGYNGNFQVINSIFSGVVISGGVFGTLSLVKITMILIYLKNKKKKNS